MAADERPFHGWYETNGLEGLTMTTHLQKPDAPDPIRN